MLSLLPKVAVVIPRHLFLQEPLLGGLLDFHQGEVPTVFRIFEDVEKKTIWLPSACSPHRAVAFFPLVDHVSLDEEVDEKGELGRGLRH